MHSGYSVGVYYTAGGEDIIISTVDPNNVTGAVPSIFAEMVSYVGALYNTTLDLEWVLDNTTQETFMSLQNGAIDAACGFWFPDGQWNDPRYILTPVARAFSFSLFQCPTFLETLYSQTLSSSSVTTWDGLIEVIATSAPAFLVCAAGTLLAFGDCPICVPNFSLYAASQTMPRAVQSLVVRALLARTLRARA